MARHPQAERSRPLETSGAERDAAARVRDHLDEKLDQALEATFPASDAFALTVDQAPARRAGDAFAPPITQQAMRPRHPRTHLISQVCSVNLPFTIGLHGAPARWSMRSWESVCLCADPAAGSPRSGGPSERKS